jgi:hypothetical protein
MVHVPDSLGVVEVLLSEAPGVRRIYITLTDTVAGHHSARRPFTLCSRA